MGRIQPVTATRTLPVIETFGPTIQGEGPLAGVPTFFIRLGLCDFRCSWCDSMYAVLPELVKEEATDQTLHDLVNDLTCLQVGPRWVTLSGGNPAIHDLGPLIARLHDLDLMVSIETQGSIWRDWMLDLDQLVASPKPPSSGMVSRVHGAQWDKFREQAEIADLDRACKIVVFDEPDLEWAKDRFEELDAGWTCHLSAGTPIETPLLPDDTVIAEILHRYKAICEKAAADPALRDVAVLPQLHVLAWGQARGV